jgi:hypothetical protein
MGASDDWVALAEALLGKAEFTPLDVARETQFTIEQLRRLWRALGFPPVPDSERAFTRSEIETLRNARRFIQEQGTDPEVLVQLTRVTGQSLARIADAQVTDAVLRLQRRAKETTPALARGELIERIHVLTAGFDQLMGYVWRRHVLAAKRCLPPPSRRSHADDRIRRLGRLHRAGPDVGAEGAGGRGRSLRSRRLRSHRRAGGPGREDDRR